MIPGDVDVCVTMDMDVFWRLAGGRSAAWTQDTALYIRMILRPSVENLDPTGVPVQSFHHRWNYRFKRPVHEALFFSGERSVPAT
jgi:hypothetical protein